MAGLSRRTSQSGRSLPRCTGVTRRPGQIEQIAVRRNPNYIAANTRGNDAVFGFRPPPGQYSRDPAFLPLLATYPPALAAFRANAAHGRSMRTATAQCTMFSVPIEEKLSTVIDPHHARAGRTLCTLDARADPAEFGENQGPARMPDPAGHQPHGGLHPLPPCRDLLRRPARRGKNTWVGVEVGHVAGEEAAVGGDGVAGERCGAGFGDVLADVVQDAASRPRRGSRWSADVLRSGRSGVHRRDHRRASGESRPRRRG